MDAGATPLDVSARQQTAGKPARPLIRVRHFLVTWAVAMALAFLVNALWGTTSLLAVAHIGRPLIEQLGWGLAAGMAIAAPAVLLLMFTPLGEMLNLLDLSGLNPLWMSLLAGSCEEVLFRGALQPIVGLWWASLLFTLAHAKTGGFREMNWTKAIYAAFLAIVSLVLGSLFSAVGLAAAICTHISVDLVVFVVARRSSLFAAR